MFLCVCVCACVCMCVFVCLSVSENCTTNNAEIKIYSLQQAHNLYIICFCLDFVFISVLVWVRVRVCLAGSEQASVSNITRNVQIEWFSFRGFNHEYLIRIRKIFIPGIRNLIPFAFS